MELRKNILGSEGKETHLILDHDETKNLSEGNNIIYVSEDKENITCLYMKECKTKEEAIAWVRRVLK